MKTILTIALISFLSLTSCTEELTDCHQIVESGEIYNPLSQYELDIQHPFVLTAGSPKTFRVNADLDTNIFEVSRVNNTNSYVNFNVQIMPRENVAGRLQNDPDPIIGEFTFINRTPGFEGQILEKNKRVFAPGSGITYPYYTFSTLHITNTMVSTTAPLYFSVEVKWNAVITWDRAMFSITETPNGSLTRYLSEFNHN